MEEREYIVFRVPASLNNKKWSDTVINNQFTQVLYSQHEGGGNNEQEQQCPEGCCTGNEILCVSIPCPIDIVLLGLQLRLELPCIRLTSPGDTPLTQGEVQQIIQVLTGVIGNLGNLGGNTEN